MGIQGLLPFLKNILTPSHIRNYRGCTVAIDAYCWLHKGAFACAEKLAAGEKTDMYVYYCMKYINMLLSYDIKPILVLDGCHLPSKKNVEKKRRERRELNRKKAAQLLRDGKRKEARDALVQCIDITPQMALELMNACRDKGVDCITAPYEADAQLAYLSQTGIAQVIITEDSDLILFGCHTIMFKMDTSGAGMLIQNKDLNKAMKLQDAHYTFDKFRYMCMLSGCDYHANLPGIGLSKACKAMKLTRQIDVRLILKKIPMLLNIRNLTVSAEYIEGFIRADNTFLYQLVFDPLSRKLTPLNPYPPGVKAEDMHYAGPPMSPDHAFQLALGNMDIQGNRIANFDPAPRSQSWINDTEKTPYLLSIWDPNYKPRGQVPEGEEPTRPSTKGKEVLLQAMGISKPKANEQRRKSEPPLKPIKKGWFR
ncbi:hypothetical protein CAPTEDRAFT_95129 [Capitella teleta]|uniref:Exonuclease 1 n=1 Tax=Capitella teleta TaxID=283909 RepID=R7UDP5_CAPTE|nr:hypothetical protein CAPTEDRAFT_95129 [Capitella teleta]|eukprot:ELU04231.1 hypothetical protein CAPTEDRAFT_95129 [Capitella teleta]